MNELAPAATTSIVNYDQKQLDLIKSTYCKGLSEPEFALAVQHSKATGLSLLTKQLYAMVHNAKDPEKRTLTFVTSIDGYRSIAAKTGQHAGTDDAKFARNEQGLIISASVTVYRMISNQRCPYSATAFWDEYYPGERYAKFWDKMPHTMLAKVAEALALRKAFPMELGGYYTSDEMAQAQNDETPAPKPVAQKPAFKSPAPPMGSVNLPHVMTAEESVVGRDASSSEAYVCQFGKWKGSSIAAIIDEHGVESLDSYVQYITGKAQAENKPLKGSVKEFIDAALIVLTDRASFDPNGFSKEEDLPVSFENGEFYK